MDRPRTHYARTGDGLHIAYQVFGEGPRDLVIHLPWFSNVDAGWDVPELAALFEWFARTSRVILFDRRGFGVSDRPTTPDAMTLEKGMEDLRAVLDAVGSDRAVLLGFESGGTVMLLFAATYPERAVALATLTPEVAFWQSEDFPWGWTREEADEFRRSLETDWGTEEFWRRNSDDMGERQSDAEVAVWARLVRLSASPLAALAIDDVERNIDVRALLPQIQVPTLVMRTRGDRERDWYSESPWVAEQIPGARYIELDSHIHFPRDPRVYQPLVDFLGEISRHEAIFARVLATVLFTDIVDSTTRAAALGDRAWADLLERHHATVRAMLGRYRGVEVSTAGDGFFATFDGPARAVMCAQAIVEAVRTPGLEVRAGVHTGEVETIDGEAGGLGVVIGARVGALAGPSEVLASQTVKDLVAGSGLAFEAAGEHVLKGVPDTWRLYRVTDREIRTPPSA